jgi:hypothetical protein
VEAAKRQDDIDDTEDGSGKDVQDSGSADDLDDEDHGSAGSSSQYRISLKGSAKYLD